MGKLFKELEVGDTLFVWWLDTLYGYPITLVYTNRPGINSVAVHPVSSQPMDPWMIIETENRWQTKIDIDYIESEAFIYGSDGPHEYKIIGTSKAAVKNITWHFTQTRETDTK